MKISTAKRLILHAPNVHTGGGKVLLQAFLQAIIQHSTLQVIALLDERLDFNVEAKQISILRFSPNVLGRLTAETTLRSLTQPDDLVLCFGNLPPLFRLAGHVNVLLQNRHLLDLKSWRQLNWTVAIRIFVERCWLRHFSQHAQQIIVQTETMQSLARIYLPATVPISMFPFVSDARPYVRSSAASLLDKKYEFIYISSADAHKNHRLLIEAWCILAQKNLQPKLCLTINEQKSPALSTWIEQKTAEYDLSIQNIGEISHVETLQLYTQAKALIFPSLVESFGLPLIEARQAGLAVLAGELDYVRDILDPEETFDPNSALSISRAVQRFLGQENSALPLNDAEAFLQFLLKI